jgi:hypothetical protein
MNAMPDLGRGEPGGAPTPQVFTRAFTVPSGWPWEQARAAQLEARHGAPLPIADLMHQVKRLGAWAPGQSAKYAAFYVRAREFEDAFETSVEVDGQALRVAFGTPAAAVERVKQLSLIGGVAGLTAFIAVVAIASALQAKAGAEQQLSAAEQAATSKLRLVQIQQRRANQGRARLRLANGARPIEDVLTDLAWATAAKTPDAKISALHWDHGLLAVEVRGEQAPFMAGGRRLERAPKPIRPGVWLWGVHADPTAATPSDLGRRASP